MEMSFKSSKSDGERYLVKGAVLVCQAGSMTDKLKLPNTHNVHDAAGNPLINIEDSKYPENIPNFGVCSITKLPCTPSIIGDWHTSTTNTVVGSASAVTTTSCLVCSKGAFILPETSGQADPNAQIELLMLMMMLGIKHGIFCFDPVNVCTGNFVDQKTDLQILGSYPLRFIRTYNAQDDRKGALGRGWRHSFELYLEDKKDNIEVTLEDGRIEAFHASSGGRYAGTDKSYVSVSMLGRYELVTEAGSRYAFDVTGKCVGIYDKHGNETAFHYEEDCLVCVSNVSGDFSFSYDDEKRLTSVTDSGGRMVQYNYDEYGTLGGVENVLGIKTQYKYDAKNRLMTAIGASGEPNFINAYDNKGRVEKQYFADGGVASLEYGEQGLKTIITEQNGNRVRYYQNQNLQNIKTVYYDGYEETQYNAKGKKSRFRDKNGNETYFEYDSLGNMCRQENPLGEAVEITYDRAKLPTKITAANKASIELAYDKQKNLTSMINPLGLITQMAYHKGLPSEIDFPDGSRLGVSFDDKLNVSSICPPTGGVLTYEYDKLNRVIATTDALNNKTTYEYDAKDRLVAVTNPLGQTQSYAYTSGGRISEVVGFDGGAVAYKHNCVGKVEEIINQVGDSTKFTYDLMWNLTSIEDACGNISKYEYDKLKRLIATEDAEGNRTTYEYDPKGNMTATTSPLGARTEIEYDALDRQTKVSTADGTSTEFAYDTAGNLTEITDAKGTFKREFDLAGQLVGITDASGKKIMLSYTALGQVASVTGEDGQAWTYTYYPGGQLKSVTSPEGETVVHEYDKNGNVTSKVDEKGNVLRMQYDALGRVTQITKPNVMSKQISYNAQGNITQINEGSDKVRYYVYSPLGLLAEYIDVTGHSTKYSYDATGKLISPDYFHEVDGQSKRYFAWESELLAPPNPVREIWCDMVHPDVPQPVTYEEFLRQLPLLAVVLCVVLFPAAVPAVAKAGGYVIGGSAVIGGGSTAFIRGRDTWNTWNTWGDDREGRLRATVSSALGGFVEGVERYCVVLC